MVRSNIPSAPAQSILTGVTSTAGEINYNDITTVGTVQASKAVIVDGAKDITGFNDMTVAGDLTVTGAVLPGTITLGGTAISATAAEINKVDQSLADVYADGFLQPRVAQATWDFAVDGGAISAIDLGVTIPANSVIIGGFYDVQTTCTSSGDTGTGAISVEGANDILLAVAIGTGTPFDQGIRQIIPATPANAVKTTTAKAITFTIAVEAFTAGKFTVHLFYIPTLVNV